MFSLGGWSPRIPPGFLVSRGTWDPPRGPYGRPLPGCHRLWRPFPGVFAWPKGFLPAAGTGVPARKSRNTGAATAPALAPPRFGLPRFRSPLLAGSRLISFPRGTKMFQFPRLPPPKGSPPITAGGLPHSDTPGSKRARRSPGNFAVRRVLHRPLAPRHPPAALCSLAARSCLPAVGRAAVNRRSRDLVRAATASRRAARAP